MKNLECFKNKIFDLLNEANNMEIRDFEINDKENTFQILLKDGNVFELECRQMRNNQIYITDEERDNCQNVADAFAELYECSDIIVVNAGKYGFARLQYYVRPDCFEEVALYTNNEKLFSVLWKEWLNIQLLKLTKGTPMEDIELKDMFQYLSKEKQKELLHKQLYFAEKTGIETIITKTKKELKIE